MSVPFAQDTFGGFLAARLEADSHAVATRWFDRLCALLPHRPAEVFPSDTFLDHIPELLSAIAACLGSEEEQAGCVTQLMAKGRELGELRHTQHASVHQLLREFEILRNVLESFAVEEAGEFQPYPPAHEVIGCLRRLNHAIAILCQTSVGTFVERYDSTIAEQARRHGTFNRTVSHELRQPLNAAITGMGLLKSRLPSDCPGDWQRVLTTVDRNLRELTDLIKKISTLATRERTTDAPGIQRVSLSTISREAARQLRDFADSRNVEIRVAPDLPDVTTDPGQLELILVNLLSNAIKYSDPAKPDCHADILLAEHTDSECVLAVRDNGLGMDRRQLARAFTPYFRGHRHRDSELGVDGTGLGLSIVRDCADLIGATLNVDSEPGQGTTFQIGLPLQIPERH